MSAPCKEVESRDVNSYENNKPLRVVWRPRWTVDVGHSDKLGLTIDDGCFIVLYPREPNEWAPGTHVPRAAIERMAELLNQGVTLD